MEVVGIKILGALIDREKRAHPNQAPALDRRVAAWRQEMTKGGWTNSNEVKASYRNASTVGDSRVVFNICGNKYRLIVKFDYELQIARVRFAGTHSEYDDIDAATV